MKCTAVNSASFSHWDGAGSGCAVATPTSANHAVARDKAAIADCVLGTEYGVRSAKHTHQCCFIPGNPKRCQPTALRRILALQHLCLYSDPPIASLSSHVHNPGSKLSQSKLVSGALPMFADRTSVV